jgi:hypothetical protein
MYRVHKGESLIINKFNSNQALFQMYPNFSKRLKMGTEAPNKTKHSILTISLSISTTNQALITTSASIITLRMKLLEIQICIVLIQPMVIAQAALNLKFRLELSLKT